MERELMGLGTWMSWFLAKRLSRRKCLITPATNQCPALCLVLTWTFQSLLGGGSPFCKDAL